jgi:putative hydrolase of HD superfamily
MVKEFSKFFEPINVIKHIERNGWKLKGKTGITDTIASHSFGAALVGWLLAEKEKVNSNKVVKILLIHDLVMAHMKDLTPKDKEYKNKEEIEKLAFEKFLNNIPEELREEFTHLVQEYHNQKTKESIIAREADELDTLFQAKVYSDVLNKNILSEFLETYKKYFKSKTGKQLWEELNKESERL